ncbi:MAG: leucine-rich repeat domain-containing protein [Candidatus Thorarchaeota archaeon]
MLRKEKTRYISLQEQIIRGIIQVSDFTFEESVAILGFICGLFFSLIAWIVLSDLEVKFSDRIMGTIVTFTVGIAGVPFLALWISFEINSRKKKQNKQSSKILDLESSGLSEFSVMDIQNLDQIQRINLGLNQLKTIDLSPLAGSTSLVELILYMNHLETIDLSPLASCPNLEYLDLTDNDLENIDLTPLASCFKLNALNIGINKTSQIDLSPLSECRDLKILTIDGMNLKEIDLSPLSDCIKLEFLKIEDEELKSLDITPLFGCSSLTDFSIGRVELTTTLNRKIEVWPEGIRKHRKRIRVI